MNAIANLTSAQLKILESRTELERLLIDDQEESRSSGSFPRSRTLRLLTSNRGIVLLAVVAGGALLLRPTLLKRAIRYVPMGPLLRMLTNRLLRNN
jgi:hypothetical protein